MDRKKDQKAKEMGMNTGGPYYGLKRPPKSGKDKTNAPPGAEGQPEAALQPGQSEPGDAPDTGTHPSQPGTQVGTYTAALLCVTE